VQICHHSLLQEKSPGLGLWMGAGTQAITLLPAEVDKVTVDSLFRISRWYSLNKRRDMAVQQRGG